ncbi:MAG: DNA polymerase II [Herpetosiphonaceae bacterium]|nr:MAG: DNA polymerase II [Herpetosiphonaceae bacterium]
MTPTGSPAAFSTGHPNDTWLFGWNPTPGIVSVWAEASGRALVWRRVEGQVIFSEERFRPWILSTTLADLSHVGSALSRSSHPADAASALSFCELNGPQGSYRYLLTTQHWRTLERALLAGAARRLGQPVTSLYDLDEYYRVGLVEQYLMQTGRVYFRGLIYADLHRLQFDLETTALDPRRGRIFLVAVRDNRGLATTIDAASPADERRLIADLCALIQERDPDVLENHNLYGFDLQFLEYRAALLDVPLNLGRREGPALLERYDEPVSWGWRRRSRTTYSVAGRELVDTLEAVRRYDFSVRELSSYRLKDVARYFGLAAPDRVYIPGNAVYETYQQEPERVRRYALADVAEVDGLSQRLLGAPFALAGMAPRRYTRLISAGPAMGILEPMLVRAYLQAGAALPAYPSSGPEDLAGHAGGAAYLFATGIAEHVVKADIASMYPSLMRTYQIGPAGDRLGVLLHLVDRLTDLRLSHKEAARHAPHGSLEAGHHTALQQAMKILINSAYGYLGAGRMALFADRAAADEVTRRGREILEHVVRALKERGMVLIEADTDGVYFAVPAGWSAEQERALVADVGATLPRGINLEYEGRYRAMFSYEVKNYALLTYDGQLIVRGVALRSSRSERFGERFLQQALHAVMIGDIVGLQRVFRETVEALRSRSLTAADVATRVRLTKTPEEYKRSRAAHREAPYEALLAAGREDWRPGERVRYYRAADGSYRWLPDETDEPAGLAEGDAQEQDSAAETFQRERMPSTHAELRNDYDVEQYVQVLLTTYAGRLRKAFAPEDFDQIFRLDPQIGLFDRPIEDIQPLWIRCSNAG